jgi:hypothetical protein
VDKKMRKISQSVIDKLDRIKSIGARHVPSLDLWEIYNEETGETIATVPEEEIAAAEKRIKFTKVQRKKRRKAKAQW